MQCLPIFLYYNILQIVLMYRYLYIMHLLLLRTHKFCGVDVSGQPSAERETDGRQTIWRAAGRPGSVVPMQRATQPPASSKE